MWSGPRNVSTAVMYSFRQRADTEVIDEPLYGHYLATSDAQHPGREEVLAAMSDDGEKVVREVLLAPCEDSPVRFFKNMAHHLRGLDRSFLKRMDHLLLTRDPAEMLPSLARRIPEPALADTGYPEQVELLEHIEGRGGLPVVLEARELLRDPEVVLRTACTRLGIRWDSGMLEWPAGPKPEDGAWAPYWYGNVHRSTGFEPYRPKSTPFPNHLRPLLAECVPFYERLAVHAIRAESS